MDIKAILFIAVIVILLIFIVVTVSYVFYSNYRKKNGKTKF